MKKKYKSKEAYEWWSSCNQEKHKETWISFYVSSRSGFNIGNPDISMYSMWMPSICSFC